MRNVDVHFYGVKEKLDDPSVRNLLLQKTGWIQEKLEEHFTKRKGIIFYKKSVDEAINLIREFEQVDIIGAIGGLENVPYYTKQFRKFYENGGQFCLTWNWASAIFNWIWQLCRGLWAKWIVYGGLSMLLSWSLMLLPSLGKIGMAFLGLASLVSWFGIFFFYGAVSNYDYFLKKTEDEDLWRSFSFDKHKAAFWVFTVVVVAGMFGYQMKKGISMQRQFMHPTIASGEKIQFEGVEFSPLPGWRIMSDFPGTQPSLFSKTRSKSMLFQIGISSSTDRPQNDANKKGNGFGQIMLTVVTPDSENPMKSLDQKEVKEIVNHTAAGYQQAMFKIMLKDVHTTEPIVVDINNQKWGKIENSIQFRGMPSQAAFRNLIWYTVGDSKLIILYLQGVSEKTEANSYAMEQFAKTMRLSKS